MCGQYIPIDEFNEHIKICLIDPRHREIKQEVEARAQNITAASGDEIASNLQAFAKKRPDLFATNTEDFTKTHESRKFVWMWRDLDTLEKFSQCLLYFSIYIYHLANCKISPSITL